MFGGSEKAICVTAQFIGITDTKKYVDWLNKMNEQGRGDINTMETPQKRSNVYEKVVLQMN